jgi:hypothetical protein
MSNFGRTSDEDYKKQVIHAALGISAGKQSEFERILRESNKFSQPEIANLVEDYSRLYQEYINRLNSRFQDWMNKKGGTRRRRTKRSRKSGKKSRRRRR